MTVLPAQYRIKWIQAYRLLAHYIMRDPLIMPDSILLAYSCRAGASRICMCALVYCLSCVMTLQFPLLAQSAESESGRLRQYEKVVLGKAGKAPSLQARLGALEQSLFGTTQKGTIDERLDRIGKAVGTPGAPPSPVPPATETAPPLTTAESPRGRGKSSKAARRGAWSAAAPRSRPARPDPGEGA